MGLWGLCGAMGLWGLCTAMGSVWGYGVCGAMGSVWGYRVYMELWGLYGAMGSLWVPPPAVHPTLPHGVELMGPLLIVGSAVGSLISIGPPPLFL